MRRKPSAVLVVSAFGCAFGLVVVYVLLAGLDGTPYDDAYFFKRFADNWLEHGTLAWNVADGPVYGITSQLFLWVAAVLAAAFGAHYVFATKIVLASFLLLCGAALARRCIALTRCPADGAVLALAALGSPIVLFTMHTGMETALALLVIAVALIAVRPNDSRASRALAAAGLTLLVYLCRPDAALIPAIAFLAAHRRSKRSLSIYGASLALAVGIGLIAFHFYYGTALPLPFYTKTRGLASRGAAALPFDLSGKLLHAGTFLAFVAPFLWIACRGPSRRGLPMLLAAAAFVLYHLASTQEIMGYRARFYLPAVIPLSLAAAAEWDALRARRFAKLETPLLMAAAGAAVAVGYRSGAIENGAGAALDRIAELAYFVPLAMVVLLMFATRRARPFALAAAAALPLAGAIAAEPPRIGSALSDSQYLARSAGEVTTFRGLSDLARCLPSVRQVYHSEIGVLGLTLPDARVVDLVGLMSKDLALSHPPFDSYCLRDRPEALFLPHRAYARLNEEIAASWCLHDYVRVVRLSSSPLYIRQDLAPAYLACARDIAPWQ